VQYDATLLNPLKAKLLYDLQNGGYGIEPADEIALFNRARDREVEAMMSRVADAGRAMAARGFPLPPGELSIHIDRAYQEMQDKVSDASRDITLQRSKLFVENRQFTITQIRELEQITMNYWNAVQERSYNAARATAEFSIAVYNALLAKFRVRFDFAKMQSSVNLEIAQAEAEKARALLEQYRGQIAAYEANLRAVIEPFQLQVTNYQAQVAGYEANVRALVDPARMKIDLYRADVEANRIEIERAVASDDIQLKAYSAAWTAAVAQENMAVQTAQVKLNAAVKALEFRLEAAKYGAGQYFAQLTAMRSAANTLSVQTGTY